jgi:NAD(P)-dependent dehydrogenase (short-subunit alcohol dehydrogenase family)
MEGRVALVTGGSRGIGYAIAETFLAAGATVMVSARKAAGIEQAVASLGDRAHGFVANAGNPSEIEACVRATVQRLGGIDILVNNAATNPYVGPLIDIDLPRFDKTMGVNLRGPLLWTQAAYAAHMREHGGSVINISSIGAYHHGSRYGVYDLTKLGLLFLTRHLAVELAPDVRVNAIAPGIVRTQMAETLWAGTDPELPPLRRLGEPDDVAGAAMFLAGDEAGWITGEVLVVDGGALVGGRRSHPPRERS